MYREAIHLLYTSNTFFISDPSVLVHWAHSPLLRPQRLAAIRRLSVRWACYSDPEHFVGLQLRHMTGQLGPGSGRPWQRVCLG